MPNIQPKAISDFVEYMSKDKCDFGSLASEIKLKSEMDNPNVVKVAVAGTLSEKIFLNAVDFFRTNLNSKLKVYHHVGIYAFTNKALMRYVNLERSKLEKLINDFVIKHDLDAQFVQQTEGLTYVRFVVEEDSNGKK